MIIGLAKGALTRPLKTSPGVTLTKRIRKGGGLWPGNDIVRSRSSDASGGRRIRIQRVNPIGDCQF
jgi:hypothetical protein